MCDVVGEDPRLNKHIENLINEIDLKIGWSKIKQTFRELIELCGSN